MHRHVFVDVNSPAVAFYLDTAEIEDETISGRAVDLIGLVRRLQTRWRPEHGLAQRRGVGIRKRVGRPMANSCQSRKAQRVIGIGCGEDPSVRKADFAGTYVELGGRNAGQLVA